MLNTSSSYELNETTTSKDSLKSSKKSEAQSPIKLPRIRFETDTTYTVPIVKIKNKKVKSQDKSVGKLKDKQAIKVNDVTEIMSKDLPRAIFKNLVISPKRTTKIFTTLETSSNCEPLKIVSNSKKCYRKSRVDLNKKKSNLMFEKLIRDIQTSSERSAHKKRGNSSTQVRAISPWMYQGSSRRFSIFAKII
ncbi:hypothetical protein SteCoe_33573 [Stentor coeruleus]|uniref:Uncharacterized protein n=1 Tax=Stentor coeruleus TaxID=5963 RepID=A0A1R2AWK4_9CILI|nr:hypothetical protein SteCoe_33573 [Stentor coeruleus]